MNILIYPDKRLRSQCRTVDVFSDSIRTLATAMFQTMLKENGIGLAACQVGQLVRLIIIHDAKSADGFRAFVNPEITFKSDKMVATEEGCLSIPGVYGFVKRAAKIRVKYQDLRGVKKVDKATGMEAIVLQHEIDHTNGILIIDKDIEYTKGQSLIQSVV